MLTTRFARAILSGLATALLGLMLGQLDLAGLNSATGRAAQAAVQRMTTDQYPFSSATPPLGQSTTSLITLDEAGVQALSGAGWTDFPPGIDQIGYMIEDVARVGGAPRAIFADLWVDGPTTADAPDQAAFDSFLRTLGGLTKATEWSDKPACLSNPAMQIACITAAGGTPVMLARPPVAPDPGLEPHRRGNQARLERTAVLTSLDVNVLGAQLVQQSENGLELTPPMALYLAYCLSEISRTGADPCGSPGVADLHAAATAAMRGSRPARFDEAALGQAWSDPFAVVWSSHAAPDQRRLDVATSVGMVAECRPSAPWWVRLKEGFFPPPTADACVYPLHLEYDRLVGSQGLPAEDYALLLKDRLVLIGFAFDNADWIPTPLHGQLPGVHWHAMATDNLLEKGLRYRRGEEPGLSGAVAIEAAVTFVLASLFAYLVGRYQDGNRPEAPAAGRRRRTLIYVGVGVAIAATSTVAVLVAMFRFWWNDPVNWIAILVLIFGLVVTLIDGTIAKGAAALLRRRSLPPALARLASTLIATPDGPVAATAPRVTKVRKAGRTPSRKPRNGDTP